jgi:DNA-binding transcriptional regulator GbsR (MarR family)
VTDPTDHDHLMAWVERLAAHLTTTDGLPPITGRILGWLMVCDPPEQSAGQIADAINSSRGSMTPNLRQLTSIGFLHQSTRPGARTTYYRLADNAWQVVIDQQTRALHQFRTITADGIDLLGPRAHRIRQADHVLAWLQERLDHPPPQEPTP